MADADADAGHRSRPGPGAVTRLRDLSASALGSIPSSVERSPRPFLLLSAPRAGSELLVDLLRSHPDIRCDGELFKKPRRAPVSYLRGRSRLARLRGPVAWGSKLLFQQLRWSEESFGGAHRFLRRVQDAGFALVVLDRRDPVMQALSLLHAERTQFHFSSSGEVRFEPMVVDPTEVVAVTHAFDADATWAKSIWAHLPHVKLTYEDHLEDPAAHQAAVDRISMALGVGSAPVASSLRSVAPRTLSERVANADELMAILAHTRFAQDETPHPAAH